MDFIKDVVIVKNGYILPWKSKTDWGGVQDESRCFVSESHYDGPWYKVGNGYDFNDYDKKAKTVVFLGFFIKHWGHYLVDCVGRLWFAKEHGNEFDYVFCAKDNAIMDGNFLRLIELLGVSRDKVHIAKNVTQFNKVIIPKCMTDSNYGYTGKWQEMFRYAADHAAITKVPDKVYLSRGRFTQAQKKEFGEQLVEKQFVFNGYTVLYPEELSLDEQISIFSNSSHIVCVNGTIPMNVLFANGNSDLRLIVLNKTSIYHRNLDMCCLAAGIKPEYIDVYYEPIKGFPRSLGEGPFWICVSDKLKQYFKDNCMTLSDNSDMKTLVYIQTLIKYIKMCIYIGLRDYAKGNKRLYRVIKRIRR